jgi:6-phospho-beta-glucosidase
VKLAILGGGGFRTPYVYQALLRDTGTPRVTDVALYDIDQARLGVMTAILGELAAEFPDPPRVSACTRLEEAVQGSDFVFAAIRVGGLEGRRCDEHVALDLNVLGQETAGPGGLAYAIRTVPVMTKIAQAVRSLAPGAFLLNFTNPAGIITEAMRPVLGDRVLGICDTPSGLGRRVAAALGLDHRRVRLDYIGLNHLGWLRRVLHDGRDVLPALLADEALLGSLEEGEVFGTDWIRALGAIPNEYLFYYYCTRDAVRAITGSGATRGDFLARTQAEFYREAASRERKAGLWRQAVARRSASYMVEARGGTQDAPPSRDGGRRPEADPASQGYAGVALAVMNAIARDERATLILNVANQGTIAALPDDAVVEVPALVDANGARPLATAAPGLHELGLMAQVKAAERHAIRAALTGSRDEALRAFALHPLVDSVEVARQLVAGYTARIPGVAAVLTR